MARSERLVGYGFQVVKERLPVADERGNVVYDGVGEVKMADFTTLVLMAGDHSVAIPFDEDGRKLLVQGLTGVVVSI